jgi:hypothetical protein
MKRLIVLVFLTLFTVGVAIAQETPPPPAATQEVTAPANLPPAPTPEGTPGIGQRELEALPILITVTADIELLADQVYGAGNRPEGWSTNMSASDPQLPVFLRLNLEIMAENVFGANQRPPGWFGTVFSAPLAIARDLRHDLELVADQVIGAPTIRPAGWQGDNPLMRCDRATQALITLLGRAGFEVAIDFTQPDACAQASLVASQYAEQNLIQPAAGGDTTTAEGGGEAPPDTSAAFSPYQVESPYVVAYYDTRAQRRAGVIPIGTGFTPRGRSYTAFSNMMMVSGDGFILFVDYTTTPLTDLEFYALQEAGTGTECEAAWCE